MCRRKIENRPKLIADVDEYIRDHTQISLEELVQSMQERGHDCTPRMVRPLLKGSGLKVKSVNGRWLWGMWDDESENPEDEQEESDDDGRPVPEPIKRADAENARLQEENRQLMVAMLKTVQLKKSIKVMQRKLLVELADLILATYGKREDESETQESD